MSKLSVKNSDRSAECSTSLWDHLKVVGRVRQPDLNFEFGDADNAGEGHVGMPDELPVSKLVQIGRFGRVSNLRDAQHSPFPQSAVILAVAIP